MTSLLSLGLLPALSLTQVAPVQPWVPSKLTAAVLAKRLDDAVMGLKSTYAETKLNIANPKGSGTAENRLRILGRQGYNIEFMAFAGPRPYTSAIRQSGKEIIVLGPEGWSKPRPASGLAPVPTGAALVTAFASSLPRLVWVPMTNGKPVFAPLVAAYASGAQGYKLRVEQKSVGQGKAQITNYRFLAQRTPQAAKKLGPSVVEIRIDGRRWLPVTIRIEGKDAKGRTEYLLWQAFYRFGEKIDRREFTLQPKG